MSAYLCSDAHINLIVNAHPDPERRNGQSFRLLLNENLRSLEALYPGRDFLKDWQDDVEIAQFEEASPKFIVAKAYAAKAGDPNYVRGYPAIAKPLTTPRLQAQIRKACGCFDYQACETSDYGETPAALFVKEVRDQFEKNEKLEGEALWGLD